MGFNGVGEFAQADLDGRTWVTGFRKMVASAATTTSGLIDMTYYAGSPPANFYASAPYVSAYVESNKGLYLPTVGAGQTQHLKSLMVMSGSASATTTTNQRQRLILADYLMYYPFIDTDAIGEEQLMENTVALPRYTAGQVIAVSQSASSAVGQFTMTYTNERGETGRISQNTFTLAGLTGGGQVASIGLATGGYHPYVALQAGDNGVQSIQSVTFTAAGGGLFALVIVKPLFTGYVTQECRRTTATVFDSFGAADRFDSLIHQAGCPEIKDGAVIGIFAQGYAGSLASSTLVGTIETVWK